MKYVLSLDGGGIRGIIPAVVLAEIEKRTGKKIGEMFDLISGTSTGGILALGLTKKDGNGNIQYSAGDLLELYLKNGGKIFKKTWSNKFKTLFGITGPRFPSKNIEEVLDKYFEEAKIEDAFVNTMVTTYSMVKRRPLFLKSWKPEHKGVLMRDAARATSAAPTFFAPKEIKLKGEDDTRSLVDGGVFINNPNVSAYVEAKRIFKTDEITVISIGTGELNRKYFQKNTKRWGMIKWLRPLLDCMFDGVSDAADYQMRLLLDKNFIRLQIELVGANDDMDDASPKNMKNLQGLARELIEGEQSPKVDRIVQLLSNK